jgi:hypothetical protein
MFLEARSRFQGSQGHYTMPPKKRVKTVEFVLCSGGYVCDKWVHVTTAWCILKLRMEERPPIWRVAANILNRQLRTADKWWSSSLGVGRGADNPSP